MLTISAEEAPAAQRPCRNNISGELPENPFAPSPKPPEIDPHLDDEIPNNGPVTPLQNYMHILGVQRAPDGLAEAFTSVSREASKMVNRERHADIPAGR